MENDRRMNRIIAFVRSTYHFKQKYCGFNVSITDSIRLYYIACRKKVLHREILLFATNVLQNLFEQ